MAEFCNFRIGVFGGPPAFELARLAHPEDGWGVQNPLTGFREHGCWQHEYANTAKYRGLPLPFDLGYMRTCLADQVLTNWMDDDGFLRRMAVQIRKPLYYSNTVWFNGMVVKKYADTVANEVYNAVDIEIQGVNQLGEVITPGTATVYLPSKDSAVKLPIPVSSDDRKLEPPEFFLASAEAGV